MCLNSGTRQGSHGQGKVSEKWKKFKVREKSGNFELIQGNLKFWQKSGKSQGILESEVELEKSGYKRNKLICHYIVFNKSLVYLTPSINMRAI